MTTRAQDQDAEQREMWRQAAQAWERWAPVMRERTAPVAQWLLDALDPQPGERVLDLAAGPGETGFMVAQRLGANGRLVSSDQSPEMVEVARRRAAELGLQNVEFAVIDAQQLELEAGSFDGAVCRWGYMLMADPDGALRRTCAVLGDGGRLALATWDRPDRNPWLTAPVIALVAHGALPPPNPEDPTPFSLHDPADLERRLRAAGFSSVRTDKVEFGQTFPSFEEYWTQTLELAAPLAGAVAALSPEGAETVRSATRDALAQFIDGEGRLEVPSSAVVALAVR